MDQDIPRTIESLFRKESVRLISVLTRILGPQNLELAEDVVQDSFGAALGAWAKTGIPENPAAWLLATARNRAIDAIRRERTRRQFASDLAIFLDSEWTVAHTVDEAFGEDWAKDDQLRMIFMCCGPGLTQENRLPLILRTLCGLSVPAIARALITSESTINKRLYRTRRALEGRSFRLPTPEELPEALDTVHTVLYLLFNEGYHSVSDEPIVRELCRDALHLAKLVVDEPSLTSSDGVALLAIMCFGAARIDPRVDDAGQLVSLDRQDRSLWDAALIQRGYAYLRQSSRMGEVRAGRYQLEAAIAARHCSARTFALTDWTSICNLYDRLVEVDPSPVTQLNRAIAISYRSGPDAALPLVEALARSADLPSHVIPAALAHLHGRAGHTRQAREFLDLALAQATTVHERQLIEAQVRAASPASG